MFSIVEDEDTRYVLFFNIIRLRFKNIYTQRYFDPLAVALDDVFHDLITIKGIKDSTTTGNFEVTIGPSNLLIHSKKTRGQGKCETKAETDAIIEQIQSYLDAM